MLPARHMDINNAVNRDWATLPGASSYQLGVVFGKFLPQN